MIKYLIISFLLIYMPSLSQSQNSPLKDYQWKNRILVIYEGNENSEMTELQLQNFKKAEKDYKDRDLIVLLITDKEITKVKNNNSVSLAIDRSQLLKFLSVDNSKAFEVFLIGKDGGIKLKSDQVLANEKLFSTIDAMPMRRNEMRGN